MDTRRPPSTPRRTRKGARWALTITAACALLVTSCSSKSDDQPKTEGATAGLTTVRMVQEWPVADGLWIPWVVAKKHGFYKDAGIDLEILPPPNTSATTQFIGTDRADLAFTTSMDVVFAQAQDAPMVSIARYGTANNWGLISSSKKPLDFAAVKGKTIGTYNDAWSKAQLQIMLHSQGLALSDVKLVTASSNTVPLLLQNKVDAITGVSNAEGSDLKSQGFKDYSMAMAKDYGVPNSPVWVLGANSKWLSSNKAVAQKFMDATLKGLQYALDNPKEAVNDFMTAYPKAQSLEFTTLQWEDTAKLFDKKVTPQGLAQTTTDWSALLKAAGDYKLTDKIKDPGAYFTNDLVGQP